ncbi:MAG: hypothetical protein ABEK36_04340 [Candidatus Aenigmatarchaeota archaeon]
MIPIRFKTATKFVKGEDNKKAKEILNRFETVNIESMEDGGFKKYIIESGNQKVMREVENQLKKDGIGIEGAF